MERLGTLLDSVGALEKPRQGIDQDARDELTFRGPRDLRNVVQKQRNVRRKIKGQTLPGGRVRGKVGGLDGGHRYPAVIPVITIGEEEEAACSPPFCALRHPFRNPRAGGTQPPEGR